MFERDAFAFANELIWEYGRDRSSGVWRMSRRQPPPAYAHRCFVLARSARQFLYHARFDPSQPKARPEVYARLIRAVVRRSPWGSPVSAERIVIPGYDGLRALSREQERLLKAECGGAWRSYCLRSHWRMVFPISRRHQEQTAQRLLERLRRGFSPIIHLVRFPRLTINHGMVVFDGAAKAAVVRFRAYDPNAPNDPAELSYDPGRRSFFLPANRYWPGGRVDLIEIYRNWFF